MRIKLSVVSSTLAAAVFGLALAGSAQPASADTYTSADFSGGIFPGNGNVLPPFSTNGFNQGDPITGSLVFDNQLVPTSGSGFVNVFYNTFPDIAAIPPATALNLTLDGLHFNLSDNLDSLLPAGIQYNNGQFNGLEFITDFAFLGNEYQFRIDGSSVTVFAVDASGNPTGSRLIGGFINTGNSSLTGEAPFVPGATPLPSALPLFASGLGALGLVGWRRKRKARISLLGAA